LLIAHKNLGPDASHLEKAFHRVLMQKKRKKRKEKEGPALGSTLCKPLFL
jgi:hypothetical protein